MSSLFIRGPTYFFSAIDYLKEKKSTAQAFEPLWLGGAVKSGEEKVDWLTDSVP